MVSPLLLREDIAIPEEYLSWVAVRASGPGGQNVNKVSSKVELYLDVPGCPMLEPQTKERLWVLYPNRFDARGRFKVSSQKTRDQSRNLQDARDKMAALLQKALEVPAPRKATRPTAGAKRRRMADKRKLAEKKRGRQGRADDGG